MVTNLTRSHPGSQVGDHAVSAAGFLTGVWPKRTEAEDVLANTTIDQVVAQQIGQDTPLPSLEVATEDFTGYVGGCSPGFSCAYMNTISWSSPSTPLPMETNPRAVFERLFGEAGTAAERRARIAKERSILDSVVEEANDLQRGLGARDRARLTDYLDNVREIERRIQQQEARGAMQVDAPDAPIGVPDSFDEHVALMFDLLAAAYQADITRVFTFMMSRELSQRTYPQIGVTEQHHSVSHHQNNPEKMAQVVKINTYYARMYAKFLEKLRSTPDGDGSLLDHSLIVYGAGMADSNVPRYRSAADGRHRRRRWQGTSARTVAHANAGRKFLAQRGGEIWQAHGTVSATARGKPMFWYRAAALASHYSSRAVWPLMPPDADGTTPLAMGRL